jgi:hypothetical protein
MPGAPTPSHCATRSVADALMAFEQRKPRGRPMTRPFSQLISALALTWACSSPAPIAAQTPADDAANTAWQLDAMIHLQRMRAFRDSRRHPPSRSARWMPTRAGSFQLISQTATRRHRAMLFLKSWNQWAHVLHVPPDSNRLVDQRPKRARQIQCEFRNRSDIPPGRRRDLSHRRHLDLAEQASSLQPVVEQRFDSNWTSHSRQHGISSQRRKRPV